MTHRQALVQALLFWLLLQGIAAVLVGVALGWVAMVFKHLSSGVLIGGGVGWVILGLVGVSSATTAYWNAREFGGRAI